MKMVGLVGMLFVASLSAAYSQTLKKTSCPLPWATPWVPDKETAKAIYLAVARTRFKDLLKQYPVVVVEDKGDFWSVGQKDDKPPPQPSPGQIIVSAGGGQLGMEIDKCSGAIRRAALNR